MATIDYKNLNLKDALDIAIIIEDDARERYRELAEQLEEHSTVDAAKFFHFMVENETKHGDQLRKHRATLFGDAPQELAQAGCGFDDRQPHALGARDAERHPAFPCRDRHGG